LSSYIARICKDNKYKANDLIRLIAFSEDFKRGLSIKLKDIDLIAPSKIDIKKLAYIVNLEEDTLLRMTFLPIILKISNDDKIGLWSSRYVTNCLNTRERRFCPACLKQFKAYNLLWQVTEIKICNIHNVLLQSRCPSCDAPIPYFFEDLTSCQCPKCAYDLKQSDKEVITHDDYLEKQYKIYKDWNCLLHDNKPLYKMLSGYSLLQSLSLKLLFIASEDRSCFDISHIYYFKKSYIKKLLRVIYNSDFKFQIRLEVILDLISNICMSIADFILIDVTDSFIRSIFKKVDSNSIRSLGNCISPWCKSFSTDKSMQRVYQYRLYNEDYEMGSVCTGCMMKYGYSRANGKWEAFDNEVQLLWDKVNPLFEHGIGKKEIERRLNINRDLLNKVYGYMLQYNLIKNAKQNYKPKIKYGNLVKYFKLLYESPGSMQKVAYKKFGWSIQDYYYYFADKKVQHYLIFETYKSRKKDASLKPANYESWQTKVEDAITECLEKNIKITQEAVMNILNCSGSVIRRNKLSNIIEDAKKKQSTLAISEQEDKYIILVDKYIESRALQLGDLTSKEIYKNINLYEKRIKSIYPDLSLIIKQRVEEYNLMRKQYKNQQCCNLIVKAIEQIKNEGMYASYKRISNLTDVSEHLLLKYYKNFIILHR
jgi:hypothetical protein